MKFKNLFFLILIFLLFPFSSCKEGGHDTYNPYSIVEHEEEIPIDNEEEQAFRDQINESFTSLIYLIHPLVQELLKEPDLLNLTGQTAETRACPNAAVSGSFPGTKTLTLTFDEDGSDCDVVTGSITKVYSGTLVFEFITTQAQWGTNPNDLLVLKQISSLNPFTVDNFSIMTTGDMFFTFNSPTGISILAAEDILVRNTNTMGNTQYHLSETPLGFLSINWTPTTVPITDPTALLNLPYTINTTDANNQGVATTCSSTTGGTTRYFSVGANNLKIQPNICGCYTDGEIITSNYSTASTGLRLFDPLISISFDFASDQGLCNINNAGISTNPPSGEPSNNVGLMLPGQSGDWNSLKVGSGQLGNCCSTSPSITSNGITFTLNTNNNVYETFQSNGSDPLRRRVVFFRENTSVSCNAVPDGPPDQSMNWQISGLDASSTYSIILFGQNQNGSVVNPANFSITGHDAGNGIGNPVTLDGENDGNFVVANPTGGIINGTLSILIQNLPGDEFSSWSGLQIRKVVINDFEYDGSGNITSSGCDAYYSDTGGATVKLSTACQ